LFNLLGYLLSQGISTNKALPKELDPCCTGLPKVSATDCSQNCTVCAQVCPTTAITLDAGSVILDRGACTACNLCIEKCPSGTIVPDRSTAVWSYQRDGLLQPPHSEQSPRPPESNFFSRSLAIRVVSTGCSACDLEVAASCNSIFDMDRFGISVVASPRFADALLITGPVPKSMHHALLSAYQAMSDPKLVIACGTCAISGGLHCGSYTEANGVGALLPTDVFIPGCPPHPLQIIQGLLAAKKLPGRGQRIG
jgi:Ni,Fe-hydrogenase III small subunit/Pyruvate/2-oxoacid:ferredoxin oxidoreductase delta subunit